jgi:5'-nucleotidase
MKYINKIAVSALLITVLFLSGCVSEDSAPAETQETLELRILHINDSHSYFDSHMQDINVPGFGEVRTQLGGMDKISALINKFKAEKDNVLNVHAGDAIMGTTYFTFFNGDAEAEVLNAMGFEAMAIGNHEFDLGDEFLASLIDRLDFPVLSANVIPASGNVLENKFEPYIIKEYDGQKVGIIGMTISQKTKESSSPSDEIEFLDEAESVQKYVDELETQGIGKIIVLCHDTYEKTTAWAPLVSEVDIIVSGDSHTLLGEDLAKYGFMPQGSYPTMLTNKDGDPVCIVQAWEYGKVLGLLDVVFEGDVLKSASGQPYLPLDEEIIKDSGKKDENDKTVYIPLTAQEFNSLEASLPAGGSMVIVKGDSGIASIIAKYNDKKSEAETEVIARVSEDLGHNRIPGDGRDGYSLPLGSDIAPLVSKAFYKLDPNSDLCIQNGGGVRVSIASGDLTLKRCYELLPFSNTMYEIKMTGSEIKQVLEDALSNALDNGSTGSFPYAYAIRYDVDAAKDAYNRISNLEIMDRDSGRWSNIDSDNMYVVITNNYIAGGKDGYITFGTVQEKRPGYDTMTDYALSFIQYARKMTDAGLPLGKLPPEEHCMKSYIPK